MAGLYVVGALLVIQVGETMLPIFDTPSWVLKTLLLLIAIGFIPALVRIALAAALARAGDAEHAFAHL